MKNKALSKSAAERLVKYLGKARPMDKFEDLIEGTRFEAPYYRVYRTFKYGNLNPRTAYYKVKYGVENLIKYFPTVWNDRDWDYHFWVEMNVKKLESMEYNIRNNSNHLHCDRDADNIKKALLALKRLQADEYHENAFKNHNEKYGKLKMDFCPPDGTGSSLCRFTRSKTTREMDIHYEEKASSRLYKHSEYMKHQDIEYATKIISKYLFHWWD